MTTPDIFGKRIIVLGCPGSGKSTFPLKLHRITGIPLISLDNVWWRADRTHIPREEFDKKLDSIVKGEQWIIDGDYGRTYEVRIGACDTVVFLDFPEAECMTGITERVGKKRYDMPWIERSLDPELVDLVKNYSSKNRPVLYGLFEKYPDKKTVIFKSRTQVNEWFEKWK